MKLLIRLCAIALGVGITGASVVSAQTKSTQKVWTINEILAARQEEVKNDNPSMCMGNRFKPCVCANEVTRLVQYRPAIAQCGKKAGIVMSGRYTRAFSVVVRDRDNRDRWPIEFPRTGTGYGGCTLDEAKSGLARCSAFKAQKVIKIRNRNGDAKVYCLGRSGYHPLMRGISRMTIKLKDVPGSNLDPLERLCLKGPTTPLN